MSYGLTHWLGMRMPIVLLLCVSFGLVTPQLDSLDQGYCTKEKQGTLESRVARADVVITGTIIRIESEGRMTEKIPDGGGELRRSGPAEVMPGRQTVGLIKLWRVVKGSLAQVANHSSGPQDLLSGDTSDSTIIHSPVLKLYGLWNDYLCGSYVTEGDTRIFFLRKFQDVREMPVKPDRLEPLVGPSDVPSNLQDTNGTALSPGSETTSTEKGISEGKLKKKKNKGGKKKKKKDREGKKRKKNKIMKTKSGKKMRKSRKKAGRKKRKTTESVHEEWNRLSKKSKRSAQLPNTVSQMSDPQVKVRREVDREELRSVLVLNASPARITLSNLNSVDEFAKSP